MANIDNAVAVIVDMYGSEFRGKKSGRFALSRQQLLTALQVHWLEPGHVRQLNNALAPKNIIVIDMDSVFPVLPRDVLQRLRRPPADLVPSAEPSDDAEWGE